MTKKDTDCFYTSSKGDKKSDCLPAHTLTALPFARRREAAAAKASEWLNAARLETTDMLRELHRKVAGTAAASPTGELNAARLNERGQA